MSDTRRSSRQRSMTAGRDDQKLARAAVATKSSLQFRSGCGASSSSDKVSTDYHLNELGTFVTGKKVTRAKAATIIAPGGTKTTKDSNVAKRNDKGAKVMDAPARHQLLQHSKPKPREVPVYTIIPKTASLTACKPSSFVGPLPMPKPSPKSIPSEVLKDSLISPKLPGRTITPRTTSPTDHSPS